MEAKDITIIDYQKMLVEARKAGIKEVVDWVNEQRVAAKTLIEGTGWGIPISEEKLDAKLKEWDIEE